MLYIDIVEIEKLDLFLTYHNVVAKESPHKIPSERGIRYSGDVLSNGTLYY